MGDVVPLRPLRKAKQRAEAEVTAAANRAKFGRTKAERAGEDQDAARRDTLLDGAKRED